jgi:hypothetical protein
MKLSNANSIFKSISKQYHKRILRSLTHNGADKVTIMELMLNNVHKNQRQGKLHIIPHQWEVNYLSSKKNMNLGKFINL